MVGIRRGAGVTRTFAGKTRPNNQSLRWGGAVPRRLQSPLPPYGIPSPEKPASRVVYRQFA